MDCNGLLINQFLIFHRNFLWCLSHLNKRWTSGIIRIGLKVGNPKNWIVDM